MKKKILIGLAIFLLIFALPKFSSSGQSAVLEKKTTLPPSAANFVLVEIPKDISKEEALNPSDNLQKRLRSLTELEVSELPLG